MVKLYCDFGWFRDATNTLVWCTLGNPCWQGFGSHALDLHRHWILFSRVSASHCVEVPVRGLQAQLKSIQFFCTKKVLDCTALINVYFECQPRSGQDGILFPWMPASSLLTAHLFRQQPQLHAFKDNTSYILSTSQKSNKNKLTLLRVWTCHQLYHPTCHLFPCDEEGRAPAAHFALNHQHKKPDPHHHCLTLNHSNLLSYEHSTSWKTKIKQV